MGQFLIFEDGQVLFDPTGTLSDEGWSEPCRKMTPDEIERYKRGEYVTFRVPPSSNAVH